MTAVSLASFPGSLTLNVGYSGSGALIFGSTERTHFTVSNALLTVPVVCRRPTHQFQGSEDRVVNASGFSTLRLESPSREKKKKKAGSQPGLCLEM